MKKLLTISAILLLLQVGLMGQSRLIDRSGSAKFYSSAPMEDIEATNNSALAVIEPSTGKVAVSMLIKGFKFDKALMQEHFNENYMESDEFPKASFSGQLNDSELLSKDGKVEANVSGEITIHGVTKEITIPCRFDISSDMIEVESVFNLTVADFDIEIPKLVRNNIAKEVEVTVNFKFQKND